VEEVGHNTYRCNECGAEWIRRVVHTYIHGGRLDCPVEVKSNDDVAG
jgi:hypothetical protein